MLKTIKKTMLLLFSLALLTVNIILPNKTLAYEKGPQAMLFTCATAGGAFNPTLECLLEKLFGPHLDSATLKKAADYLTQESVHKSIDELAHIIGRPISDLAVNAVML